MRVLPAIVRQAALNPQQLARRAIRNPRLFPALIEGLQAEKPRIRYGCAKALCQASELHPDRLYPHFDFFVGLLDHENKILQWDAAFVLSQLARADGKGKLTAVLDKYFAPVSGPVMITAANVIQGGARIAQAKPQLADRVATEILKAGKGRYKTAECRNIAIGHAITALSHIRPLLRDPKRVDGFVRKQVRNRRPATRKKAERFLKSLAP